jgi:hypothetical protein
MFESATMIEPAPKPWVRWLKIMIVVAVVAAAIGFFCESIGPHIWSLIRT